MKWEDPKLVSLNTSEALGADECLTGPGVGAPSCAGGGGATASCSVGIVTTPSGTACCSGTDGGSV